jgi:hypothetical protein
MLHAAPGWLESLSIDSARLLNCRLQDQHMIKFDAPPRSSLRRAATTGAVFVLSTLALTLIYYPDLSPRGSVFVSADHLYYISSYLASRRFGSLMDLQTFPFGQGFGVFQHPALPNPLWWIWELTNSDQLTYLAAMFALFVGVLIYYLSLRGESTLWAIFAAFGCGTLVFNNLVMADYYATGMPQTYFQIGVAYFACAILLGFGPRSTGWLLFGIALLYVAIVMDWPYALFLIPFILLSASAALPAPGRVPDSRVPGRRVDRRRVFAVIGVSAAAAALLFPPIYTAYDGYTLMSLRLWAHAFMPHEAKHSLLIWGGLAQWKSALILGWTGLLAAIYHIWRDRSRLLVLSFGLALVVSLLAFFDNDAVGSNVYWPLPPLGYFERPLLPLYVILITAAIEDVISRFARQPLRDSKLLAMSGIGGIGPTSLLLSITAAGAAAAFASLAWAAWPEDLSRVVFRRPIQDLKAENFVRELSLPAPVWPIYSPYFYDGTKNQLLNDCQHANPYPSHYYCLYMFDLYSAPNAIEYQNLIDIQFPSIESQMIVSISRSSLGHADLSTSMKSFGIRYVAIDGHWPSAMKYIKVFEQEVSLIDLGSIQSEDLSINKVLMLPYAAEDAVTARIEHRAIVHDDKTLGENQNLSPVDLVDMEYRRGAMAVRARSKGDAVLLLPFQFSNCLVLDNLGKNRARLIRVNGGQAALSFAREVDVVVRNEFRFFGQPTCRYRDFVEVFRLGLHPVKTMDEMTEGYRVPLLMRWYLASRVKKRDRLLLQRD